MRISGATVAILTSEEGHDVLRLAVPELSDSRVVQFYVEDTDDLGLWVRLKRKDRVHLLLVRWEYVLTVDFPAGEARTMGLRT